MKSDVGEYSKYGVNPHPNLQSDVRNFDDAVWLESIRTWKARDAAWRARQNKQFDDARARVHAAARQAKADARRERDVVRKREDRAGQVTGKRIHALERAVAERKRGDHFLVKLIGRAQELAAFREVLTEARKQHGPKASLTKIASMTNLSKPAVQNRLEIVAKLEAPHGAWHRWRSA